MGHDGAEGVSPDGWLPDRVTVGALTKTFPPGLIDEVVEATDTREVRRRLLPARLVVYFVLALWLFRGRNCGYARVLCKLVDGLYHRRRGQQLLDGCLDPDGWVDAGAGRRWRPPASSSLGRARARLGSDPLRMLFEAVAGPVGADPRAGGIAAGVFCGGLRVISLDGSTSDLPDTAENAEHFGRPSNATRDGAFPQVRWLVAAESGTGALVGATLGPYTVGEQTLARDLLSAFGPGNAGAGRPELLVPRPGPRRAGHRGAHPVAGLGVVSADPDPGARRRHLPGPAAPAPAKADGPPITVRVIEYTVHSSSPDGAEEPSEVFALVTDLLDVEAYPALDLACAYPMRWGAETVIGHHKTDMGEGMPVLRSHDPEGVAQEMWALFAVYQAIHTLIGAAADATGVPPEKISFPHALAAATDSVTAGFPPSRS